MNLKQNRQSLAMFVQHCGRNRSLFFRVSVFRAAHVLEYTHAAAGLVPRPVTVTGLKGGEGDRRTLGSAHAAVTTAAELDQRVEVLHASEHKSTADVDRGGVGPRHMGEWVGEQGIPPR